MCVFYSVSEWVVLQRWQATVPDMFVHNNSIGFAGWTDPLSFICSLSATAYSFGGLGETCPTGTEIITVEECQMAIQALGILQAPARTRGQAR